MNSGLFLLSLFLFDGNCDIVAGRGNFCFIRYIGNRFGCFIVDFNFGKCCRKIRNNGIGVSLTVSFYSRGSKRFPPFESSDLGIQKMDRLQNNFRPDSCYCEFCVSVQMR